MAQRRTSTRGAAAPAPGPAPACPRWWPDRQVWERIWAAARTPSDPDSLDGFDPELVRLVAGPFSRLLGGYFRMEIEGMDLVPRGPALIVGNHNSGMSFLEGIALGARWYEQRGTDEPWYGLAHDTIMALPYLGNFLHKVGAVRASHGNAEEALRRGGGRKVIVFPGGEPEAFRPYRMRNRIRFDGRKGFVRLALRAGVPIVPLVSIGGQEGFFVLSDGAAIARALRLDRLLRVVVFPVAVVLPWGFVAGPFFHLPLPTKVRWRFLEPLALDGYGPQDADDDRVVDGLQREVVARMQRALDEMAAARRFPVIG